MIFKRTAPCNLINLPTVLFQAEKNSIVKYVKVQSVFYMSTESKNRSFFF